MNVAEKINHKKVVHWYRKDQRTDDHEIISRLQVTKSLTCFFIEDPKSNMEHPLGFPLVHKHRKTFLQESLDALQKTLKKQNIQLHIFKTIDELMASDLLQADILTYQKLCGTEELTIEKKVQSLFKDSISFQDFTLVNPADLPFSVAQMPPMFTAFRKKIENHAVYQAPISIPELPESTISSAMQGGEKAAMKRIATYFYKQQGLSRYKETRNGMIGQDYSSRLSPWLANGNISARMVYHFIRDYEMTVTSNESTYWLFFELLWRDFFQLQLQRHGAAFFKKGGIQNRPLILQNHEKKFWKWAHGQTGDDLVDANMEELKTTGWMSNRGRQNVASYLVHDLHVNWQWGAAWMEHLLIDYDPASNWGNWMYIAGVGHDPRPFRKFNTVGQAERYDPNGEYRRLWLK